MMEQLKQKIFLGEDIGPVNRLWLLVLFDRYKVKRYGWDELIVRMDIVPPSLALAQAAEESGWGASRFVRQGNAIFGEWTSLFPHEKEKIAAVTYPI